MFTKLFREKLCLHVIYQNDLLSTRKSSNTSCKKWSAKRAGKFNRAHFQYLLHLHGVSCCHGQLIGGEGNGKKGEVASAP